MQWSFVLFSTLLRNSEISPDLSAMVACSDQNFWNSASQSGFIRQWIRTMIMCRLAHRGGKPSPRPDPTAPRAHFPDGGGVSVDRHRSSGRADGPALV